MNQSKIRKVGDGLGANNSSWTFKGKVAKSFDDHFAKSVPFCKEGQKLVTQISDFLSKKLDLLRNRLLNRYLNKNDFLKT